MVRFEASVTAWMRLCGRQLEPVTHKKRLVIPTSSAGHAQTGCVPVVLGIQEVLLGSEVPFGRRSCNRALHLRLRWWIWFQGRRHYQDRTKRLATRGP